MYFFSNLSFIDSIERDDLNKMYGFKMKFNLYCNSFINKKGFFLAHFIISFKNTFEDGYILFILNDSFKDK